jgi:hypothetical protein
MFFKTAIRYTGSGFPLDARIETTEINRFSGEEVDKSVVQTRYLSFSAVARDLLEYTGRTLSVNFDEPGAFTQDEMNSLVNFVYSNNTLVSMINRKLEKAATQP